MPNVNLNVTLNDGNLDVDQAGNGNQMGHGHVTTITWHLLTPNGTFNGLGAANKGFAWIQKPPAGVFTGLQTLPNGKIQITDNNTDPGGINSTGTWIYQLWATIDKVQYSTTASLTITTLNPTIKNL